MKGAPLWKIGREARRIGLQVRLSVRALFAPVVRRAHDRSRPTTIRRTPGLCAPQACTALYLIHQPAGVLPSTLHACRFLNQSGYSVQIVSNAPLSEADREHLAGVSSGILERPNVGYDFGGYRDGILDLLDAGAVPERLFVMNDSVWFPLFDDTDLLDRMRAPGFDIFGPVMKRHPGRPEKDHLCSFAFSFSRSLMQSEGFAAFWRTLPLSNEKATVIKTNERVMTQALGKLGFSFGALVDFEDVVGVVNTLPAQDVADYLALLATERQQDAIHLLALRSRQGDTADWLALARQTIATKRLGRLPQFVHPAVAQAALRLPFLRKHRSVQATAQRRILQTLPIFAEVNPTLREEIAGWDRD